jgi:hypothetical protein
LPTATVTPPPTLGETFLGLRGALNAAAALDAEPGVRGLAHLPIAVYAQRASTKRAFPVSARGADDA